jgi:hypothetical protein
LRIISPIASFDFVICGVRLPCFHESTGGGFCPKGGKTEDPFHE